MKQIPMTIKSTVFPDSSKGKATSKKLKSDSKESPCTSPSPPLCFQWSSFQLSAATAKIFGQGLMNTDERVISPFRGDFNFLDRHTNINIKNWGKIIYIVIVISCHAISYLQLNLGKSEVPSAVSESLIAQPTSEVALSLKWRQVYKQFGALEPFCFCC